MTRGSNIPNYRKWGPRRALEVRITKKTWGELRALAEEDGRSVDDMVELLLRYAIEEYSAAGGGLRRRLREVTGPGKRGNSEVVEPHPGGGGR